MGVHMARTYTIATMNFIDVTALGDATENTASNESFGNLSLLKENIVPSNYGTYELNQFILDGSKDILPDHVIDIAFWSVNASEEDCSFTSYPTITVDFTSEHTSSGITLYFQDVFPKLLTITWYTMSGTKIISNDFTPDALTYFCRQKCANYGKVVIEFKKTWFPCQCVKLQYIMYGQWLEWQDDTVLEASLTEEIDVTSSTLSINTLDISILDANNDFDIGVDNGNWENVQKTQEITVKEYVNGDIVPCGTFYMDSWDFKTNVASFGLIDAIGYLDRYTFKEGKIYNGDSALSIIDSVMQSACFSKYTVADNIKNIQLYGYLGICTCRAALQQICFAIGAVADCSRSDTIRIYKPDRHVSYDVGTDRKFNGQTQISLDEYVSGIMIKYNMYNLDSNISEIYKDTMLSKGENELTFFQPVLPDSITVSGGTLKSANTGYCIIEMESDGLVTVSAKQYITVENSCSVNVKYIRSGESENIKEFSGLTLRPSSYKDKANDLLDYYALQKKVDMEYLLKYEGAGNWLAIDDNSKSLSVTLLESQSIDLTGGFIASAKCRGYSKIVTDFAYMPEIYCGEVGLI